MGDLVRGNNYSNSGDNFIKEKKRRLRLLRKKIVTFL